MNKLLLCLVLSLMLVSCVSIMIINHYISPKLKVNSYETKIPIQSINVIDYTDGSSEIKRGIIGD